MTPPEAPVQGQDGRGAVKPPAVSVCLTLTRRADFLRAAQARRQGTTGFLLQARERRPEETDPQAVRIGYTCSKKLGNAVARNRAKRRLRAIARAVLPGHARPGWDYVLVGRPGATATHDFAAMTAELARALDRVHGGK
ncbi:MAG: ribonuclease P protein component [Proteobacteria bacterium]|nr:ribonuclease P protein component [Pseudomonadota bacterium]